MTEAKDISIEQDSFPKNFINISLKETDTIIEIKKSIIEGFKDLIIEKMVIFDNNYIVNEPIEKYLEKGKLLKIKIKLNIFIETNTQKEYVMVSEQQKQSKEHIFLKKSSFEKNKINHCMRKKQRVKSEYQLYSKDKLLETISELEKTQSLYQQQISQLHLQIQNYERQQINFGRHQEKDLKQNKNQLLEEYEKISFIMRKTEEDVKKIAQIISKLQLKIELSQQETILLSKIYQEQGISQNKPQIYLDFQSKMIKLLNTKNQEIQIFRKVFQELKSYIIKVTQNNPEIQSKNFLKKVTQNLKNQRSKLMI